MFYEKFSALCKSRKKTPSAVLEEIGLTRSTASFWKKGSVPSSENLQKLAEYFGVPTDYLLGTSETIAKTTTRPEACETIENAEIEASKIRLKKLIECVNAIPKESRNKAIREIAAYTEYTLHKYKNA